PCPCGYLGHPRQPCSCPPSAIDRYRRRISGPLLDRIDLRLEVPPPTLDELAPETRAGCSPPPGLDSLTLRGIVERARERAGARGQTVTNASLDGEALDRFAPVAGKARVLLERATHARGLSARALQSLRRVALSIADLTGERSSPGQEEFAEALALRRE
ncbi:MAG: ATP-binding protein, partial [Planctomycetota bacterium]